MKDCFILYHNSEARGGPPQAKGSTMSFYTTKSMVKNTIGSECFIIVGTGRKNKQYYLWSYMTIDKVKNEDGLYIGSGRSLIFKKNILLNNLPGFADFKKFCGNFGLGFQNINKTKFKNVLIAIAKQKLS